MMALVRTDDRVVQIARSPRELGSVVINVHEMRCALNFPTPLPRPRPLPPHPAKQSVTGPPAVQGDEWMRLLLS